MGLLLLLLLFLAISGCLRTSRSASPSPNPTAKPHKPEYIRKCSSLELSLVWCALPGATLLFVLDASPPSPNPTFLGVGGLDLGTPALFSAYLSVSGEAARHTGSCGEWVPVHQVPLEQEEGRC